MFFFALVLSKIIIIIIIIIMIILDKCPQLVIYVWHLNKLPMSYYIVMLDISKYQNGSLFR